jgi:hypothetical protein
MTQVTSVPTTAVDSWDWPTSLIESAFPHSVLSASDPPREYNIRHRRTKAAIAQGSLIAAEAAAAAAASASTPATLTLPSVFGGGSGVSVNRPITAFFERASQHQQSPRTITPDKQLVAPFSNNLPGAKNNITSNHFSAPAITTTTPMATTTSGGDSDYDNLVLPAPVAHNGALSGTHANGSLGALNETQTTLPPFVLLVPSSAESTLAVSTAAMLAPLPLPTSNVAVEEPVRALAVESNEPTPQQQQQQQATTPDAAPNSPVIGGEAVGNADVGGGVVVANDDDDGEMPITRRRLRVAAADTATAANNDTDAPTAPNELVDTATDGAAAATADADDDDGNSKKQSKRKDKDKKKHRRSSSKDKKKKKQKNKKRHGKRRHDSDDSDSSSSSASSSSSNVDADDDNSDADHSEASKRSRRKHKSKKSRKHRRSKRRDNDDSSSDDDDDADDVGAADESTHDPAQDESAAPAAAAAPADANGKVEEEVDDDDDDADSYDSNDSFIVKTEACRKKSARDKARKKKRARGGKNPFVDDDAAESGAETMEAKNYRSGDDFSEYERLHGGGGGDDDDPDDDRRRRRLRSTKAEAAAAKKKAAAAAAAAAEPKKTKAQLAREQRIRDDKEAKERVLRERDEKQLAEQKTRQDAITRAHTDAPRLCTDTAALMDSVLRITIESLDQVKIEHQKLTAARQADAAAVGAAYQTPPPLALLPVVVSRLRKHCKPMIAMLQSANSVVSAVITALGENDKALADFLHNMGIDDALRSETVFSNSKFDRLTADANKIPVCALCCMPLAINNDAGNPCFLVAKWRRTGGYSCSSLYAPMGSMLACEYMRYYLEALLNMRRISTLLACIAVGEIGKAVQEKRAMPEHFDDALVKTVDEFIQSNWALVCGMRRSICS